MKASTKVGRQIVASVRMQAAVMEAMAKITNRLVCLSEKVLKAHAEEISATVQECVLDFGFAMRRVPDAEVMGDKPPTAVSIKKAGMTARRSIFEALSAIDTDPVADVSQAQVDMAGAKTIPINRKRGESEPIDAEWTDA